jgi:hypothetical protein
MTTTFVSEGEFVLSMLLVVALFAGAKLDEEDPPKVEPPPPELPLPGFPDLLEVSAK